MDRSEELARIFGDWHERREQGELVAAEDVIAAHPSYADELRDRFAAIEMIEERFPQRGSIPSRIGEFHIVREIGRGGMGVVYEAKQPSMRRSVALKVLLPSVVASPRAVKRFQREAQATGALKHTNIVQVHQLGEEGGIWFCALELVDGRPLGEVLDGIRRLRHTPEGTRPPGAESDVLTGSTAGSGGYYRRVAEMLADVADALAVAHEHGVVHRDVKPSNLLLDVEGRLKIIDFGLARLDEAAAMTMTGDVVGTPNYMSPEQILGRRESVDHRTDVYSLGATVYEILCLRPPFSDSSLPALVRRIAKEEPRSPRARDRSIPRDLDTIVLKALEKDPAKRYATAGVMARDLRAFAEGHTIQTRRAGPLEKLWRKARRNKGRTAAITAVTVLAIAAVLLGLGQRREAEHRKHLEYADLLEQAQRGAGLGPDEAREGTEALLTRAVALKPEAHEAYFYRGLLGSRDLDTRLGDLDAAERRGLPARTACLGRALLLWNTGRIAAAQRELDEAAGLPGGGPTDDWLEALVLGGRRQWNSALERLDRAVEAAPTGSTQRRSALEARAQAHRALGDLVGELEDLLALRQQGHDLVNARMRIATLWRRLGRQLEARRAFDALLERVTARGQTLAWQALTSQAEHDWKLESTAASVAALPDSAALWITRADACRDAYRYDEARKAAQRALDLEPENPKAWAARALATIVAGQYWRAYQDARHALSLAPDDRWINETYLTVQMQRERYRDVLARARALRVDDPYDVAWALSQARALRALRRNEEALAVVDEVSVLAPAAASFRVEKIGLLRQLSRDDEASILLDEVLGWEGLTPDDLSLLAGELLELERDDEAMAVVADLVARKQAPPAAFLLRAHAHERNDDADAALADTRAALAIQGHHLPARRMLLRRLRAREGLEAALAVVDGWIERDPNEVLPHLAKGGLLVYAHRPAKALEALAEASALDPTNVEVLRVAGHCFALLSRPVEAYEAVRNALAHDPEDPVLLTALGGHANNLGRYEEGAEHLEKALALDPEDGSTWAFLAVSYQNLNRADEAYEAAQRGVEVAPHQAEALRGLAGFECGRGRYAEALTLLDRVEDAAVEEVDAHTLVMRSEVLGRMGRQADALAIAARIARDSPDLQDTRTRYAVALRQAGRFEESLREHEASLRLSRDSASRWGALAAYGSTLRMVQRWEEAEAALEEALTLRRDPQLLATMVELHYSRGNFERARALAEEAIAHNPTSYSQSHQYVVNILARGGTKPADLAKAIEVAREHVRLFPDATMARGTLGSFLRIAGRVDEAIEVLEDARTRAPKDDLVLRELGYALQARGKTKRYLDLVPTMLEAQRAFRAREPGNLGAADALLRCLHGAAHASLAAGEADAARGYLAELDTEASTALDRWPANPDFWRVFVDAAFQRTRQCRFRQDWAGVLSHGAVTVERLDAAKPVLGETVEMVGSHCSVETFRAEAAVQAEAHIPLVAHNRAALRLAQRLLALAPGQTAVRQQLPRLYVAAAASAAFVGQYEEALTFLAEGFGEEMPPSLWPLRIEALAALGRTEEARAERDRMLAARALPQSALGLRGALRAALRLRDAELIELLLDSTGGIAVADVMGTVVLALRFLGADEAVGRVLERLPGGLAVEPKTKPHAARLAWFAALLGRDARARELLADLTPDALDHAALPAARAWALLGDRAEALRYLEAARAVGETFADDPVDPVLARLVAEPAAED